MRDSQGSERKPLKVIWWDLCDWLGYQWFRWQHRNDPPKEPADLIRETTAKVRDILKDEPADKFVHTALEACEHLEKAFDVRREGRND